MKPSIDLKPIKMAGTLGEWPLHYIRLRCNRCVNIRFFMKGPVVRKYGADSLMPDLIRKLMGCERNTYSDYCGGYYSDALAINEWDRGLRSNPSLPWRDPS